MLGRVSTKPLWHKQRPQIGQSQDPPQYSTPENRALVERKIRPTTGELREKKEEVNRQIDKKLHPIECMRNMKLNVLSTKIASSIRNAVQNVCSLQSKEFPKFNLESEEKAIRKYQRAV